MAEYRKRPEKEAPLTWTDIGTWLVRKSRGIDPQLIIGIFGLSFFVFLMGFLCVHLVDGALLGHCENVGATIIGHDYTPARSEVYTTYVDNKPQINTRHIPADYDLIADAEDGRLLTVDASKAQYYATEDGDEVVVCERIGRFTGLTTAYYLVEEK